jgi:hypothetical protein
VNTPAPSRYISFAITPFDAKKNDEPATMAKVIHASRDEEVLCVSRSEVIWAKKARSGNRGGLRIE